MSSGMSFPDKDARKSLQRKLSAQRSVGKCGALPNSPFSLQHPVSLVEALALHVDFFQEQPVDLLKLHLILVGEVADLIVQLLNLNFESCLVLVH